MESEFKRQKIDCDVIMLEDLPEEIILKIVSHLALKDLFNCMVLCKRIRNIAYDNSLWETLNLVHNYQPMAKGMPYTLFPKILAKGCKYLSINSCHTYSTGENLRFENNYQLKYLGVMSMSKEFVADVLPDLMASLFSLEKLSVRQELFDMTPIIFGNTNIYSKFFKCIIQNSKTLRVLDLGLVDLSLESVQHIFNLCQELTELNLTALSDEKSMNFLCENLTSKIEKIDFGSRGILQELRDYQLTVLLRRCNKISELSMYCARVSNDSASIIIENLSQSLVKLEIDMDNFSLSRILELAAMPKLQVLCDPSLFDKDNLRIELEKRLPAHLKPHLNEKLTIVLPYPCPEEEELEYDDVTQNCVAPVTNRFWEVETRPRIYQF